MPGRAAAVWSRVTLRLQLTLWFVLALIAVEGAVFFTYWFAQGRPEVERTAERLDEALAALVPLVELRDGRRWSPSELELLAIRADLDVVDIVNEEGVAASREHAVFTQEVVQRLLTEGRGTWLLEPLIDEAGAEPAASSDVEDSPTPPSGPSAERAIVILREWPVVGAAQPFIDSRGAQHHLLGASAARSRATPETLSAVLSTVLVGILSATLAAWVVLGRALRPLLALAESARSIGPRSRDERLELGGGQAEVDTAQRSFNEALDRLESGYDALDLFIGNVTHELRTPVATVLAEARQVGIRRREPEEYERFVRSTGDEMARLAKMIHSFLTLARMDWEERRGMVVRISLLDVAVDVVHFSKALAEQHDVRLVLTLPDDAVLEFDGDPELIASMFDNLIRNAIRFSPRGDEVEVRLEGDAQVARIRVKDHGPGIPEPLMDNLYEPFVQGRRDEASGRGSGIGLAIAQKVAELHGGTIVIRNHEEGGAEALVELPLTTLAAPAEPEDPPEAEGAGGA